MPKPVMNRLCIMFDLENTLIDDWHAGSILTNKVEKIKSILKEFWWADAFGIFSFAVDNVSEKPQAKLFLKSALDLEVFSDEFCPSFNELEDVCDSKVLFKFELVNIYGKDLLFPKWAAQFPAWDFVLFDDALGSDKAIIKRTTDDNTQTLTMIRV